MLRNACTQAKSWVDEGLPVTRMAVNVSGQQFVFGTGLFELRPAAAFCRRSLENRPLVHDQPLIDCSDDRAIAAAIIAMSRSLRINVTAEGVENFPQLLFLQEHDCHEAQGYLFSRALPAAEAQKLLHRAIEASGGTRTQRLRSLIG
ncbi:MAG: EAL domain-containing protein [Steroidobacteraceae bacterium]